MIVSMSNGRRYRVEKGTVSVQVMRAGRPYWRPLAAGAATAQWVRQVTGETK